MGDIGKYFSKREFTCRCGCGFDDISPEIVARLDSVRGMLGKPIQITSGCRCKIHNAEVGGKPDSAHTKRLGVDIKAVSAEYRYQILLYALTIGNFSRVGISRTFIHLDIDESLPQEVAWMY